MIEEVLANNAMNEALRPLLDVIEKHEEEFHNGKPCNSTREYITIECCRIINADPYVIRDKIIGLIGTGPKPTATADVSERLHGLLDKLLGMRPTATPDVKPDADKKADGRPLEIGDRVRCTDPSRRLDAFRGKIGVVKLLDQPAPRPEFKAGHVVVYENVDLPGVGLATSADLQVDPQFLERV